MNEVEAAETSNYDGKHVTQRAKDRRETDCGGGQRGQRLPHMRLQWQLKSGKQWKHLYTLCKLGVAYRLSKIELHSG